MNTPLDRRSGPRFVLAAGGTGGHLFPAQALAERLVKTGARVVLATDRRADAFARDVPGVEICQIWAGRIGGGPIRAARGFAETAVGILQARLLLRRLSPDAVVGFGGYTSIPTMLAAIRLSVPTAIHEQNAVLGRANRLLAGRARCIATGFAATTGLRSADKLRAVHTGNPVRPEVLAVAGAEYRPPQPGEPVEILITGGSQGARIFAEIVPEALAFLPPALRGALRISQQARPEDCDRVSVQLKAAGIAAEISSFFTDIPRRLARAQLVICRSGASTIAELAAVGRPALLVPYPFATDDHQTANARAFADSGAAWVMPQPEFSAARLSGVLGELLADPAGLLHAAAQARRFAPDDAADRLAALVLGLAAGSGFAGEERAA
ncbi:MAG TPA: undecaprenyldiphospho-muramoylpentapeptide beta-N-acetylglucosaminyltransferase [Stellaceae bacterium]|nr:undecaprenyldiphospho-muramoylpentapeptide beta-N-acetylglucosaminyltransferase [Stellaceae bacterium]